jgi:pimeloyl-ACP methyl ester carboxylesterase
VQSRASRGFAGSRAEVAAALAAIGLLLACGGDPGALPPEGQRLSLAGGAELNLLTEGSGDTVVLVHGLPGSASDWDALAPRLAGKRRVIRYDRVGFGFSSRRGEPGVFTLEQNARELVELLDALALDRVALVGWSTGGGIVQVVAARWPERVTALVLVSPDAPGYEYPPDDPTWKLMVSPIGIPVTRALLSIRPLGQRLVSEDLATAFAGRQHIHPGVVAQTHALLALPGAARTFIEESRQYDLGALEPESIQAPTLIIHGDADGFIPMAIVEQLDDRIPDSRLIRVRNGSHMLPMTHAGRLDDQIASFTR